MSGKTRLSPTLILKEADTFYRVKLQYNTWDELSHEEQELIAMKATFKYLNLHVKEVKMKAKRGTSSSKILFASQTTKYLNENWRIQKGTRL